MPLPRRVPGGPECEGPSAPAFTPTRNEFLPCVLQEENSYFLSFEFSLCMSGDCLGKMIVFMLKTEKRNCRVFSLDAY